MKVIVHCWRGESSVEAGRVHTLFGSSIPVPTLTSRLDETLLQLERPFLLLAHEAELDAWECLYQAVRLHLKDGQDWAIIRYSMGAAKGNVGPIVPGDRRLAVLRNGLPLLLDHLEQAEQAPSIAGFRASVCAGSPDFSQLCRKVPNLLEHPPVGTLRRWLSAAEVASTDPLGATEEIQTAHDLQGRAATILTWLAEVLGAIDAKPALTIENARNLVNRARRHPWLDYLD